MTGDFNGDGTPDLACMYDTGGDTNSIKVLLGDGTGKYEGDWETWDTNIWYDCDNVTNRFVAGDFNGDGKDDIAALYDYTYYDATDSGQVQVFRSTGTDFASKEWWYYGGKRAYDASKTAGLVSADYNGDGKAEIHALYDMGSGQANVYEFRKKEDFALDRFALVTDAWNSYAVLVEDENAASGLLESVTNGTNAAIRYTYDGNGNITEIREGTQLKARYAYDSLNQLIREDNAYTGKTVTYTYDAGGNILGKTEYTYTTGELGSPTRTVVYGYTDSTWKDLLTSYDGTAITYDTIGNPLNWRGGMSFTWQNGRQLAGISKDGLTASYAYNDSGIRLRKTVNGVTTQYYLNGSLILSEVTGDVQTDYYYDESGNVFGFKRGNSEYYYIRNGQGDIIGILDSSGTQVVSYVYDSWGKLVSISGSQAETIGETNPFRYRGYYYDTETGLYYLNSRYYDPEVGRFLNIDSVMGVNGDIHTYNLFTYCGNNPVNRADPTGAATEAGTAPGILDVLIGLVVGAIEGATASASALGGLILSMPLWLTSSVDTSIVQPKVKAKTESRSLEIIKKFPETYFGAAIDKKSGEWAIVTAPMTMDQAILWTQLTGMSGIFNTNDSWGIYTLNPINSYKIALCMSGWEIPYGPEHHKYGEFAHYHPGSRKMLGRYKHFHFWFGLPY